MENRKPPLNTFLLTGAFVSSMLTIQDWPFSAQYGFSSIFFILFAVLFFLLPIALVSAELSTGWPSKWGVFYCVKEAFGRKAGMTSILFIWWSNIFWYPTILSFCGSAIFASLFPELAHNKFSLCFLNIALFWGLTFLNMKGAKIASWVNSGSLLLGTLFPAIFIISLAIVWFVKGKGGPLPSSVSQILPKFHRMEDLVILVGIFLGYAGMEMPSSYSSSVKNPERSYPRAILFSSIIIISVSVLGTFSLGLAIPKEKISLISGSIDVIKIFLADLNIGWAHPLMALSVGIGSIGGISTWIGGPSKSLWRASEGYFLPRWLTNVNEEGIPVGFLILQATLVSLLSLFFLFLPNLNMAYWSLTALSSQLYVMAYFFLFSAAIYLRYKCPNVVRKYQVSRSNVGMWVVGGTGMLTSIFSFTIGFFPPTQIETGNGLLFNGIILSGMLLIMSLALMIRERKDSFPIDAI